MAGWEDELAILLHELGVTQEEPKTHLQATRKHMRNDAKQHEEATDVPLRDEALEDGREDDDIRLSDLSAMRREVNSIVRQVIHLMQRGDLDKTLKEDVMVVLRALRRRATVTMQAEASDEAYLEFASAMLHFCRLVLRLSESAIEDA